MKLKVAHSNYLPTILSALARGTADYFKQTKNKNHMGLLSEIKKETNKNVDLNDKGLRLRKIRIKQCCWEMQQKEKHVAHLA